MKEIVLKNENDVVDNLAESYLLRIHEDVADIRKGFIRLGFHLDEIKRCEYYKSAGYEDFYEFCQANYAFSPTTTKRLIEVWFEFGMRENGALMPKMWIDEKYADYSYSQLVEMLPMSEEVRSKIRPSMTVKEIRSVKTELKEKRCDVAPEKCRFNGSYPCKIEAIIKKHFMKNGNIVGCAGCCQCCTSRSECEYVCDAVKNQNRDVAQKETVSDESEIDMQRDNLLNQLHTFYNSLAGCWERLTLSEKEYIDQQYEMLQAMIRLLH